MPRTQFYLVFDSARVGAAAAAESHRRSQRERETELFRNTMKEK